MLWTSKGKMRELEDGESDEDDGDGDDDDKYDEEEEEEEEEEDWDDAMYEVEQIVAVRTLRGKKTQYRVRWVGYEVESDSWMVEEDINAPDKLAVIIFPGSHFVIIVNNPRDQPTGFQEGTRQDDKTQGGRCACAWMGGWSNAIALFCYAVLLFARRRTHTHTYIPLISGGAGCPCERGGGTHAHTDKRRTQAVCMHIKNTRFCINRRMRRTCPWRLFWRRVVRTVRGPRSFSVGTCTHMHTHAHTYTHIHTRTKAPLCAHGQTHTYTHSPSSYLNRCSEIQGVIVPSCGVAPSFTGRKQRTRGGKRGMLRSRDR